MQTFVGKFGGRFNFVSISTSLTH